MMFQVSKVKSVPQKEPQTTLVVLPTTVEEVVVVNENRKDKEKEKDNSEHSEHCVRPSVIVARNKQLKNNPSASASASNVGGPQQRPQATPERTVVTSSTTSSSKDRSKSTYTRTTTTVTTTYTHTNSILSQFPLSIKQQQLHATADYASSVPSEISFHEGGGGRGGDEEEPTSHSEKARRNLRGEPSARLFGDDDDDDDENDDPRGQIRRQQSSRKPLHNNNEQENEENLVAAVAAEAAQRQQAQAYSTSSNNQCRDVFFALLFLAQFGVVIILAGLYGDELMNNPHYHYQPPNAILVTQTRRRISSTTSSSSSSSSFWGFRPFLDHYYIAPDIDFSTISLWLVATSVCGWMIATAMCAALVVVVTNPFITRALTGWTAVASLWLATLFLWILQHENVSYLSQEQPQQQNDNDNNGNSVSLTESSSSSASSSSFWNGAVCFVAMVASATTVALLFLFTCWYRPDSVDSKTVPMAAANVRTAVAALRANAALYAVTFVYSTLVTTAWMVLWTLALLSVLVHDYRVRQANVFEQAVAYEQDMTNAERLVHQQELQDEIDAAGPVVWHLILLILSYVWTQQIVANIITVTTAGTIGHWWHYETSKTPDHLWGYLFRALYRAHVTSFGSICLSSLVTGTFQVLEWMGCRPCRNTCRRRRSRQEALSRARQRQRHDNHEERAGREDFYVKEQDKSWWYLSWECLSCGRVFPYFHRFAYIYVGMYGSSYSVVEAGQAVLIMFQTRFRGVANIGKSSSNNSNNRVVWRNYGFFPAPNNQIVSLALWFAVLTVGALTGCFATALDLFMGPTFDVTHHDDDNNTSQSITTSTSPNQLVFWIGFFVGGIVSYTSLSVLDSAVRTVTVCFVEEPKKLLELDRHLFHDMEQAWKQAYPLETERMLRLTMGTNTTAGQQPAATDTRTETTTATAAAAARTTTRATTSNPHLRYAEAIARSRVQHP